jgi:hypothetical protein
MPDLYGMQTCPIPILALDLRPYSNNRVPAGICYHREVMRTGTTMLLLSLAACGHFAYNLQEVEPERFYRSGQMAGRVLEATIDRLEVRTVVNLRGKSRGEDWYREEVEVCAKMGVAHHDFDWSMNHLPKPDSLAGFVDVIRDSEEPILVHCSGGVHRSGAASAVYLLVQGARPAEARGQFGLEFRNAPIGMLVDLYEASDLPFDVWVTEVYPDLFREYERDRAD